MLCSSTVHEGSQLVSDYISTGPELHIKKNVSYGCSSENHVIVFGMEATKQEYISQEQNMYVIVKCIPCCYYTYFAYITSICLYLMCCAG